MLAPGVGRLAQRSIMSRTGRRPKTTGPSDGGPELRWTQLRVRAHATIRAIQFAQTSKRREMLARTAAPAYVLAAERSPHPGLSERRRGARCQTKVSGYYCGLWWSDGVVHGRRVLPLRCAASPASAFPDHSSCWCAEKPIAPRSSAAVRVT